MDYARPDALADALQLLASGDWQILSGGTDFYPALNDRPPRGPVLDISALSTLRGIADDGEVWRLGALTTWSEVIAADLPPAFDGLKLAAREVGSTQIQNRATVAGNICNASPAADGVPPLLTLDARVQLVSRRGPREVPLADFLQGNRKTLREPDELVTAILIPKSAIQGRSSFLKLGARKYMVISITMAAVRLVWDASDQICDAAVSVGACSAVAQRLPALEKALRGQKRSPCLSDVATAEHFNGLSPIGDVRASADYRLMAARVLVGRAIELAATTE